MDYEKTLEELKHMKVETGSFVCLGCGHEHNCSIHGCAILRDAVECIEEMKRVLQESEAARAELGMRLAAAQKEMAAYKDTGLEPEEIKSFVEDVVSQFAYRIKSIDGHAAYSSGGLSTMETAFAILGWDEPHLCPECECEATGCHEWATCGTPTKDGYKRLCGKHFTKLIREEAEAALKGGEG